MTSASGYKCLLTSPFWNANKDKEIPTSKEEREREPENEIDVRLVID